VILAAHQFSALHDFAAAHKSRDRPTHNLEAFVRRVVGAVVKLAMFEGDPHVRIPDRDVGFVTDRDASEHLAIIEAFEAEDAKAARKAVQSHIRSIGDFAVATVR
jgi:hypothetical protein